MHNKFLIINDSLCWVSICIIRFLKCIGMDTTDFLIKKKKYINANRLLLVVVLCMALCIGVLWENHIIMFLCGCDAPLAVSIWLAQCDSFVNGLNIK